MHRVAIALLWIAFSTWYSYCLRPVEWPVLSVEPAQAMPESFSHLYADDFSRIQAAIDAGAPVVRFMARSYLIDGNTIHLRAGEYQLGTRIDGHGALIRYSGRYAIRIDGWEDECAKRGLVPAGIAKDGRPDGCLPPIKEN